MASRNLCFQLLLYLVALFTGFTLLKLDVTVSTRVTPEINYNLRISCLHTTPSEYTNPPPQSPAPSKELAAAAAAASHTRSPRSRVQNAAPPSAASTTTHAAAGGEGGRGGGRPRTRPRRRHRAGANPQGHPRTRPRRQGGARPPPPAGAKVGAQRRRGPASGGTGCPSPTRRGLPAPPPPLPSPSPLPPPPSPPRRLAATGPYPSRGSRPRSPRCDKGPSWPRLPHRAQEKTKLGKGARALRKRKQKLSGRRRDAPAKADRGFSGGFFPVPAGMRRDRRRRPARAQLACSLPLRSARRLYK